MLYADKITESMKRMIAEANRQERKQLDYNQKHNITPSPINREMRRVFEFSGKQAMSNDRGRAYFENENMDHAADPVIRYMPREKIQKLIRETAKAMEEAVKQLDFLEAARLRDELLALKKALPESENT